VDDAADLIRAIASLSWPVVAAAVLFRLLPAVSKRIRSGDISVKFGQLEVSVQDASDNLRKQVKDLQDAVAKLADASPRARSARGAAPASDAAGARVILWISSDASRHAYEVATLEEDGISVELADRAAARSHLAQRRFDAVVTDADESLVREVRAGDPDVPILVYATGDVAAVATRLTAAGASSVTSSPLELFRQLRSLDR
jgi:CheY-like chemotaxis protein